MIRSLIFIIALSLTVLDVSGQDVNSINAAKQQYDDLVKREEDKLADLERSLQQAYVDYNNAVREFGASSDNAQQNYKWILILQSDIEMQRSIVDNAKQKRRDQVNIKISLYNKTINQQNKDLKDQRRSDFFEQKQLQRKQAAEKAEERRREEEAKDNMRAQMAYDASMKMSQAEYDDNVAEARWKAEGAGAEMVANSFRAQDFINVGQYIETEDSQSRDVDLSELESLLSEASKEAEQGRENESEVHTFTAYVKDGVVYAAEDNTTEHVSSQKYTAGSGSSDSGSVLSAGMDAGMDAGIDAGMDDMDMSYTISFLNGKERQELDSLVVLYDLCRSAFAIQSNIYGDSIVPMPQTWEYVAGMEVQEYNLFSFADKSRQLHILIGEDFENAEQFNEILSAASLDKGYVFHYYVKNAVLYKCASHCSIEILINDYENIDTCPDQIVTFPASDFPSEAEMCEIFDSKINAIRSRY